MNGITVSQIRQLISYDPKTGGLTWKSRGMEFFKATRDMNCWNARFSGKAALTAMNSDGYLGGSILNKSVKAHRIAWVIVHGYWADHVDHINGKKDDNRITNLRSVSNRENCLNQSTPKNNTSGVLGVYWHKGKKMWCASIKSLGKQIDLGTFASKNEAVDARKQAEDRYGFHKNHGRPAYGSENGEAA